MKLVTMSRREIESQDIYQLPSAAICIAYPNGRLHRVQTMGGLTQVHHTRFSDCDEKGAWCFPDHKDLDGPNAPKALPMTRGQAIDILDFVRGLPPEVETLYIACYGGVSRSRGVAAGLAAVFGWNDRELYERGHPNAWCKVLIQRAARGAMPAPERDA